MAKIKTAVKRVRVNEAKQLQNRMVKSAMLTAIKKFNAAITAGNTELAEKLLPDTMSAIDNACSKGVIHINNAAHKKAAASKKLHDLKTGKFVVVTENKISKRAQAKAAEAAKAAEISAAQAAKAASAKEAAGKKDKKEKPAKVKEEKVAKEKPVKEKAEKAEKPAKEKAEKAEKPVKEKKAKAE